MNSQGQLTSKRGATGKQRLAVAFGSLETLLREEASSVADVSGLLSLLAGSPAAEDPELFTRAQAMVEALKIHVRVVKVAIASRKEVLACQLGRMVASPASSASTVEALRADVSNSMGRATRLVTDFLRRRAFGNPSIQSRLFEEIERIRGDQLTREVTRKAVRLTLSCEVEADLTRRLHELVGAEVNSLCEELDGDCRRLGARV